MLWRESERRDRMRTQSVTITQISVIGEFCCVYINESLATLAESHVLQGTGVCGYHDDQV
jgi:hypothetical protein